MSRLPRLVPRPTQPVPDFTKHPPSDTVDGLGEPLAIGQPVRLVIEVRDGFLPIGEGTVWGISGEWVHWIDNDKGEHVSRASALHGHHPPENA